ncbi:acyltransferase family protein [Hyphococcus sp.]|uniref:acyltransferase family protein n=1 Tax=Hyphococcus sp. TaxID=2038636 RepID=UPI003D11B213
MGMFRLILAMAVVLGHARAGYAPMNAGLAVQGFFVISGFYMALILDEKYASATKVFYTNRLLRLFPSYLIVLFFSAVALFAFDINDYTNRREFLAALSTPWAGLSIIIANLTLLGQDVLCWFDVNTQQGLLLDSAFANTGRNHPAWNYLLVPQAWSLSFELMFYALAPFLARCKTWILVALAAASIAIRQGGVLFGEEITYDLWPRRLFPAELCLFLFGMIAYRGLGLAKQIPQHLRLLITLAMAVMLLAHAYLPISREAGNWLVYLGVAITAPIAFLATGNNRMDRMIGDLSYPIYITHILIIALVHAASPPQALWLMLAGVFGASALLLFAVERPLDRWRQLRLKGRCPPLQNRTSLSRGLEQVL